MRSQLQPLRAHVRRLWARPLKAHAIIPGTASQPLQAHAPVIAVRYSYAVLDEYLQLGSLFEAYPLSGVL